MSSGFEVRVVGIAPYFLEVLRLAPVDGTFPTCTLRHTRFNAARDARRPPAIDPVLPGLGKIENPVRPVRIVDDLDPGVPTLPR